MTACLCLRKPLFWISLGIVGLSFVVLIGMTVNAQCIQDRRLGLVGFLGGMIMVLVGVLLNVRALTAKPTPVRWRRLSAYVTVMGLGAFMTWFASFHLDAPKETLECLFGFLGFVIGALIAFSPFLPIADEILGEGW